jgi:hypothetical protein
LRGSFHRDYGQLAASLSPGDAAFLFSGAALASGFSDPTIAADRSVVRGGGAAFGSVPDFLCEPRGEISMSYVRIVRIAAAMILPALAWAGTPTVRAADEKPAAAEKKDAPEAKPRKAPADFRGPLPLYYTKVVSPDQKEKIYAVQTKYEAEIKALQAKIAEIEAARNKEIDAMLTPDQLKRVEELRAEAQKARTKTGAARKPAEGDAKTDKPAEGK